MSVQPWSEGAPGVFALPSGRRVRGRRLGVAPPGDPAPTFAVQLAGRQPPVPDWEVKWIRWRDFWLPADPAYALAVLRDALGRTVDDRVEVGCPGGVGRTGTALAALAVLDGVSPKDGVDWVRARYHPRAVEVPWQRRFLAYVERSSR